MTRSSPSLPLAFRAGARAAVPVWIAFVPSAFAMGLAAKAHGLHAGEIVLMSALVYAGPAQLAALEPLASGRPAFEVLLATLLVNLRFLVMSAALAPYFRGTGLLARLISAHVVSASSFVLPYAHFQRTPVGEGSAAGYGRRNLGYFLGVGTTSFAVWVLGSGVGYWAALRVPEGFEDALGFVLPSYFASMLAMELRERTARLVALGAFALAPAAMLVAPGWGWIAGALLAATLGWRVETWTRSGSR